MSKFNSRYKELTINAKGKVIQFVNHEFNTKDPEIIAYLKKNQGSDYTCISDKSDKQNIDSLKLQARDAGFPGDVDSAKKDDLIQWLESHK